MKKAIMPGEAITTEEEFLAGKNTYTEDGLVKASTLGEAQLDNNTKEATIKGKSLQSISVGDTVYGVVTTVKENTVMVELKRADNGKTVTRRDAQIPVRNISNEFVSRTRDFYRIGDIVKAKINRMDDYGIDLETKGVGLGVIEAFCSKCRHDMMNNQGSMKCLNCGNVEGRKWFENEDEYKPRERSDDRGFRGRDNRSFGGRDRHDNRGGNRSFGDRRNNHGPSRSFGNDRRTSGGRNDTGGRRNFNSNGRSNFGGRR